MCIMLHLSCSILITCNYCTYFLNCMIFKQDSVLKSCKKPVIKDQLYHKKMLIRQHVLIFALLHKKYYWHT